MASRLLIFINTILLITWLGPLSSSNLAEKTGSATTESYSLPVIDKTLIEGKIQHVADGQEKIKLLRELAEYYVNWESDYRIADSLLIKGIEMAELSYQPEQLLNAYANYLLVMDDYRYVENVKQYIRSLTTVGGQLQDPVDIWKYKIALAKGYQLTYKMEEASDYAYQALTGAIQLKDQELTVKSHLLLGNIHREMNNNVEAIRNLLDALTIAESNANISLRMECYDELSGFYNLIKAYDKSISYKLKELELAENALNPDSIRIMNLKFDLEVIAFNNRTLNENQLYNIIDFANRHHIDKLKRYSLIAFRNHLIKQNDLAQLYKLFHNEYPEELAYLRINDTTTYYRMQALFNEHLGQIDSARLYYEMVASRLEQSADKLRQASFFMRYGDFLSRNGDPDNAIDKYTHSYNLSAAIPYFEFMLEATGKLEKIFLTKNDYANAYKYTTIGRNITDSLQNLMQKEQIQLMEIDNEEQLREQKLIREREETRRRNNIQYTAITIIIATTFILLVLLGGFNVSPTLIRMVGFLCFIFFFEFLILLFDTWIHHLTHGEPWQILAFKIILMSGLLPLHHIVEKKATHYLIHHKLQLVPKKTTEPADIENV